MQIRARPSHLKLRIDHPPQPHAQRRCIRGKHLRIAHQRAIRLQLLPMLAHKRRNALTAYLLFPLNNHTHVHRQPRPPGRPVLRRPRLHQALQGLHMHPHLPLVIHRPTRVQVAIPLRGLKRRRHPLLQRLRRLHIIVPIQKHRRRSIPRSHPLAIHQGMPLPGPRRRLNQPHSIQPRRPQPISHKLSRPPHITRMRRIRRNGRNPQQILQLLNKPPPMLPRIPNRRRHTNTRLLHVRILPTPAPEATPSPHPGKHQAPPLVPGVANLTLSTNPTGLPL